MKPNNIYKVLSVVKLHTKPLREATIYNRGKYIRETSKFYVFDCFKIKKENLVYFEKA